MSGNTAFWRWKYSYECKFYLKTPYRTAPARRKLCPNFSQTWWTFVEWTLQSYAQIIYLNFYEKAQGVSLGPLTIDIPMCILSIWFLMYKHKGVIPWLTYAKIIYLNSDALAQNYAQFTSFNFEVKAQGVSPQTNLCPIYQFEFWCKSTRGKSGFWTKFQKYNIYPWRKTEYTSNQGMSGTLVALMPRS